MKIALRLIVLAIIALALSFGVVSAQQEGEGSIGGFIQAANSFTLEVADPGSAYLTLTGVASVTPVVLSAGAVSGYDTEEFITDWLLGEAGDVRAVLQFQVGNPLVADEDGVFLRDFNIAVSIYPVEIDEDGNVVYNIAIIEILGTDFLGTSLSDIQTETMERPGDVLNRYWEDDEVFSGENLVLIINLTPSFAEALAAGRIARLDGARPSGVGGSCIPGVSCP